MAVIPDQDYYQKNTLTYDRWCINPAQTTSLSMQCVWLFQQGWWVSTLTAVVQLIFCKRLAPVVLQQWFCRRAWSIRFKGAHLTENLFFFSFFLHESIVHTNTAQPNKFPFNSPYLHPVYIIWKHHQGCDDWLTAPLSSKGTVKPQRASTSSRNINQTCLPSIQDNFPQMLHLQSLLH